MTAARPLRIFVHYASEFLTDHESFGDGLICFSLLNGLAKRGHQIFAYTNHASLRNPDPKLTVKVGVPRSPASAIARIEHGRIANRWFAELDRQTPIDLVWRMHPYGDQCPVVPRTDGRPLVVGPIFYGWPADQAPRRPWRHRGPKLWPMLRPFASAAWKKTMRRADLILCATAPHSKTTRNSYPDARVLTLPVIVDADNSIRKSRNTDPLLVFVGNLNTNKHPEIFCQTLFTLRKMGLAARGTVIGDGPLRPDLENLISSEGAADFVQFLGKIPNSEVINRVRLADFFVSCSIGEPYGRAIVEAMSVGIVPVCHASGGPNDFIDPNRNGKLIANLDAAEYAAEIQNVWKNPGEWESLSGQSLEDSLQWKSSVVLQQLEEALLGIIQKSVYVSTRVP